MLFYNYVQLCHRKTSQVVSQKTNKQILQLMRLPKKTILKTILLYYEEKIFRRECKELTVRVTTGEGRISYV